MKRLRPLMHRTVWAAAALLFPAASALAQVTPGGGPPSPSLNRSPSPLIGFGIMFLLLVAVVAVSIMPSRRGHQD